MGKANWQALHTIDISHNPLTTLTARQEVFEAARKCRGSARFKLVPGFQFRIEARTLPNEDDTLD